MKAQTALKAFQGPGAPLGGSWVGIEALGKDGEGRIWGASCQDKPGYATAPTSFFSSPLFSTCFPHGLVEY